MKIKKLRFRLKLFFCDWLGKEHQFECGHKAKLVGKVAAFGQENIYDLKDRREYCHECLAKMSIKCGACQNVIMVGDGVTVLIEKDDFQVPDGAVLEGRDPLKVIACLRHTDCIMDIAGTWDPPGKIEPIVFI